MISLLTSIADTLFTIIDAVVTFVTSLIDGLINLFTTLPTVVSLASSGFGYLPSTIAALATLGLSICVIYIIVGRNLGSGS